MSTQTAEALRASAQRTRESALRCERNADMNRGLEAARDLERQAEALALKEKQATAEKARQKKLVQKVKIAQKQLNMHDDDYRTLLEHHTGARSAAQLKAWQLENVLQAMKKLGFKPKPPKASQAGTRPQADDAQSRMIRALWLQLHEVDKVHDPSERALVNWCKGQFKTTDGIEALQWFSLRQKRRLIEQLKLWLSR